MTMEGRETIVVFCAHNDDQIIGAGGTLARYSQEGKRTIVYIFSYGENSHPHLKRKVIVEQRVKESRKSDAVLGIEETKYFGLKEGKFLQSKGIRKKVREIVSGLKPAKIFIHAMDDAHPDHRAVNTIVLEALEGSTSKNQVFSFGVWNILTLRKRNSPQLIVDISDTFHKKVKALKTHESQQVAIWSLLWNVYLKALLNGFNHGVRYAEIFYRIR